MFSINKSYIVYRWRNKVNNKSYIGITCNPNARKRAHKNGHSGSVLSKAILKYGINSFEYNELNNGVTITNAVKLEKWYIKEFNSYTNGYNLTEGGEFGDYSKISDKQAMDIIMSPLPTSDIATKYDVVDSTISSLRSGYYRPYLDRTRAPKYQHKLFKLTEAIVVNIIMNPCSHQDASFEYGVSYSLIASIRRGDRWRSINRSLAPKYNTGTSPYTRRIM